VYYLISRKCFSKPVGTIVADTYRYPLHKLSQN